MNIDSLVGSQFFLVPFNEEFCWEIEEDGFVIIIGKDHFDAFKTKVASRLQQGAFYFLPRCKFTEMQSESCRQNHQQYAHEYLEKVIELTREISFEEFKALNNALGRVWKKEGSRTLFVRMTNQYSGDTTKPKFPYVAWGYSLFYTTIMDDD